MILNFAIIVVVAWLAIYACTYFIGFKYLGLVTREHDGQYELLEFWYNGLTNDYKTRLICRGTERTYNMWNEQRNVNKLHNLLDEINSKYG